MNHQEHGEHAMMETYAHVHEDRGHFYAAGHNESLNGLQYFVQSIRVWPNSMLFA
jgi:hypothetical protein